MSDRVTIDTVAERAGVSKATVSAVINNKQSVRDSTRQRVLEIIEELDYRPQGNMMRFRSRRNLTIGMIIKEPENPFYLEVARGVRDRARTHQYTHVIASSEGDYEEEQHLIEMFQSQGCRGLIVAPVLEEHTDLSHLFELKRSGFPFVVLSASPGVHANLVGIDNAEGAMLAVKYLIEQGHTRILHFAGPAYSKTSQDRIDGVRRAFSESHLRFTSDTVIRAGATMEDGYRTGMACFQKMDSCLPTAVTCYNDLVAVGLYRALRELGLDVPQDVSIIGYDDIDMLEYFEVPLTSVRSPNYMMGDKAAGLLIRQIESKKLMPPERIIMEAELVLRASTRANRPEAHLQRKAV